MLSLKYYGVFYPSAGYGFKFPLQDKRHCHIDMNTTNYYEFLKNVCLTIPYIG